LRRWALVAALACLVAAPAAHADADPASDYLLRLPAFVPPDDNVPAADAKQLNAVLAAAKARGFEIRVALIGTQYDMGSVSVLFKQPKRYARFLGQELFFVYKGRALVVMPNGYGFSKGGKAVPSLQTVVASLPAPGANGHALAAGAITAVRKLAATAGVSLPVPKATATSSGRKSRSVLASIVVLILLLAAAGAAFWVRRRRRR
jgi:hypothetical protein